MKEKYSLFQLILLLTPFVFSFAFGLDIYIPIVPQMVEIFDTSPALIQLTLSLFLFTTGFGQLFIGPLSDRFGRRSTFFASSLLYTIGAIACATASNIEWLIAARGLSSLGACGMLVSAFALVRDLYSGEKSAKIYSLLNGAIGISPTFAPLLGGYLAASFGWHSVFLFLALIGLISFLITQKWMDETHLEEKRTPISTALFKRYGSIFKNRTFLLYTTLTGISEGIFFCFFSISPFIIIEELNIPMEEFGYYFAVFGLVIALGGFASAKIVDWIGSKSTILLGIALILIGGMMMVSWHYLAPLSLQSFLIPMAISCTGSMFVVGCGAAFAMEPFEEIAGTASAAFGALQFGLASIIGTALMMFPTTSTLPYGIFILMIGAVSTILFSLPATFTDRALIESAK